MGLTDANELAEQIFRDIDADASGTISFNEFCTAAMDQRKLLQRSKLRAAFKLLDVDQNGSVDFDELCKAMRNNGQVHSIEDFRKIFE